ncbi:D-serine ammonia-lyase [Novosphingobium mangrovi (ex Hu et al. 2023)]|uniref:Probable D-serine dehydratase n=1 Tax=Novosphingobium mangrovi (ex Hu et al. 2023) TaxID=2930094 RepID=A0ABT0ACR8_9SPHN|nr:D-serine ammonia-lyase [Novosphingobium mangrovi (ex Hu et al. 2023)]MCJ1960984.1 D-serine ammonia-lyase [Novosphingobium mangrovi (ex Hu et al. 2023)]
MVEVDVRAGKPVLWINPERAATVPGGQGDAIDRRDFAEACEAWQAMQPLLLALFPRDVGERGVASDLLALDRGLVPGLGDTEATVYLKRDDSLPVAGSIKARGGFFEVVRHAHAACVEAGIFAGDAPFEALREPRARAFLATRRLLVASTGNLGLSVGLIGRALGFAVDVHMSRDAKDWKKSRLRDAGAQVIEHASDYISAVHAAAQDAGRDPACHFVDDEHSADLFLGYSAAVPELKAQLDEAGMAIGPDRPLFVYLPCGIGGAPGGIAYGLHELFGGDVHCFFAEPVAAPCMLTQMLGGYDAPHSVYDFGLDGRTEADGLAVTQASLLVARMMRARLAGVLTESDEAMLGYVRRLHDAAGLRLEPSATAGLSGPGRLLTSPEGLACLEGLGIGAERANAVHVVWATGGSLVPDVIFQAWLAREELS